MRRERLRHIALVAITAAATLTLVCCVVATPWTPQVFAAAIVVFPIALMLLGASQAGPARAQPGVLWTLATTFVVLATAMAGLFWTKGGEGQIWGLPAGAVLLVVGLFFAPLALSTLGFALSFEVDSSQPDDSP